MPRSYKDHLRAIGRKPIKGKLRTSKKQGDVELAWDAREGEFVGHVHEGESDGGNVVPIKRRVTR